MEAVVSGEETEVVTDLQNLLFSARAHSIIAYADMCINSTNVRISRTYDAVGCSIQEVAMMGVHGQKINNIIIFVQNVDLDDKNG